MRETKKLKGLRAALAEFTASENGKGVCMCGDEVKDHLAFTHNHSPVDSHDYTSGLIANEIIGEIEAIREKNRARGRLYRERLKFRKQAAELQAKLDAQRAAQFEKVEITLHRKLHQKLREEAEERGTTVSALVQYYLARGAAESIKSRLMGDRSEEVIKMATLNKLNSVPA